jgi:hypothetical protein
MQGLLGLFRLFQLHKRGASMTECLHPPGTIPRRSGGGVNEQASDFAVGHPIFHRRRPYQAMECEGYDAMRRIIRYRVPARGIRGFGPFERFIAAPPGGRDQPCPPVSPTAALEAIEGVANPDAWLHALMTESARNHHHKPPLFYFAPTLCAHGRWARAGRELSAAATLLQRLIETRTA